MKVYVHLGSREKIDFNLKLSDDIMVVKNRISKDRAIPVSIQRLYDKYQNEEDPENEYLRDGTKLSQIKNDKSETQISAKRTKIEYIRLYLYGSIAINIRSFGGNEISINFKCFDADLRMDSVKNRILKEKGYPCTLQKLYLGDSSMSELHDHESVMSPQIIAKICSYGLILRLTGKIPLRNITKGTVHFGEIDAMVSISRLKQQIQNICEEEPFQLYINGNDIQSLEDSKRLCDYNIRNLLSYGILMKQKPMSVHIKGNGSSWDMFCDIEEPVKGFKDRVSQLTGLPIRLLRLIAYGKQMDDDGILRNYNIEDRSTIHLIVRCLGD